MATGKVVDLDVLDPTLYERGVPHETYAELRRQGPVLWHPTVRVPTMDAEIAFWAVMGHRECQQVSRDWQTFAAFDGSMIVPWEPERRGTMLVSKDPPEHTEMRRLIHAAFTPRMIARLDEQIMERTGRILDAAEAKGDIDFVADVAYQLPMHVIADILGIDEDERPEVFRITDVIVKSWDAQYGFTVGDRHAAEVELFAYARHLSDSKRAHPSDDVWSTLANGELDEFELDMFFLILSVAGSETTRNAITQGLMALVEHRDQLDALRADPSLIHSATEEMLRWSSPVICFARTATRDIELGGEQVKEGDRVAMFYPSANRDEAVFAEPDRFDVTRAPNPHIAFGGGGPHFCLGANLARTEMHAMIGELLRRFPDVEITGPPRWLSAGPAVTIGVGVQELPVRLHPR